MKLRVMLYGLTLMLGCFALASCINDEEGPCLDSKTQVVFKLVLQDNAQTRAGDETWNNYNPKETGVEYDNYINLDGVQVLMFKGDGTYVGKLGELTYNQTGVNTYQYVGLAPDGLASGGYKFVILANCADAGLHVGSETQAASTIDDLKAMAFNLYAQSDNTEYIPMWGTKGIDAETTLTVQAGTRQSIGTISLLRAMSKVTVKLQALDGATGDPLRGYSIQKAVLSNYNKSGFVVPTGYDTALETKELNLDASLNVKADPDTDKEYTLKATGGTELTFYLAEYDNIGTTDAPATPAVLTVYLTKTVGEGESATTINFNAPIQFCDYFTSGDDQGKPDTTKPYNIIRNHWYQYNIYSVSDDGALYVKPTVKDWIDADALTYTIDASSNMRLFDSWLYRYDKDGDLTTANYTDWATSHMMVSSNVDATSTPANRPMQSPQIQLVTSGSNTFELYVDNPDFEILRANKNDVGVVTSYDRSTDGTLTIAAGTDVYTYFYIMPKSTATAGSIAKVFLYYNDPALGKQKMTYNNNSLPGYSDDSSEIWVYYVAPGDYKYVAGSVLKMYYQDVNNPLVPASIQN